MFNNPLLVYFGQELGERGMESEGFSGCDGRTTIFDYWSIELMRKWKGDGNWQTDQLPEEAQNLRSFYCKLLNLVHEVSPLYRGRFYDLMWANKENVAFNSGQLYAFLRYDAGKVCLVLANFGAERQTYKLRIPPDAMNLSGMESESFYHGKDLLTLNKSIQFPGVVAINGGFGGIIEPFTASVYELIGQAID